MTPKMTKLVTALLQTTLIQLEVHSADSNIIRTRASRMRDASATEERGKGNVYLGVDAGKKSK